MERGPKPQPATTHLYILMGYDLVFLFLTICTIVVLIRTALIQLGEGIHSGTALLVFSSSFVFRSPGAHAQGGLKLCDGRGVHADLAHVAVEQRAHRAQERHVEALLLFETLAELFEAQSHQQRS